MKLSVSSRPSHASLPQRSLIVRRFLRQSLFRHSWDTRCRNLAAARLLRPLFSELSNGERTLLDVGSGEQGVSSFLKDVSVTAVDLHGTEPANTAAVHGDVAALPFSDRSFPVVSCIDVLEHLPVFDREKAVSELVRVARRAVLMTFPCGPAARSADEDFLRSYQERGRSAPDWVQEHLQQSLPNSGDVSNWVWLTGRDSARGSRIALYYNESVAVCRFLRAAAVRSTALYFLTNLLFGVFSDFMPAPDGDKSYRVILLATFE